MKDNSAMLVDPATPRVEVVGATLLGDVPERAVRDTLLRMEEAGLIELPPRKIYNHKNKANKPIQAPLFDKTPREGLVKDYPEVCVQQAHGYYKSIWKYLLWRHHYLGLPKVVGAHLCQVATIDDQVVACLAWASAAACASPTRSCSARCSALKRPFTGNVRVMSLA